MYARSVEKCFTREATAIDNCPTDREVFYLETEDFLLYSKLRKKKRLFIISTKHIRTHISLPDQLSPFIQITKIVT